MPEVEVNYVPRGAALELFNSKDPEVVLSGAAGTGKSVAALMYLHLSCLINPKARALIVRKTHASLTASTLVTFREKVAKEAIEAGALHFYGGSAQEPPAYRYYNGSVIVMGGLDRATRLLSTEFDLALVDEAIEATDEDLDTIASRLRNGVISHQRLIMCTNPGPPTHHLKLRADAGRCRMLYSTHKDNPRLYDDGEWTEYGRTYMARLASLTGVRRARLFEGKWVAAEGLVYDEFDPNVHLIDHFDPPADWTRWWSVDFGYTNPMVVQFWAEDSDGRLYLYRELYRAKRLVEDFALDVLLEVTRPVKGAKLPPRSVLTANDIRDDVRAGLREWIEPKPRAIVCDHDAEDRATLERHVGIATVAADKRKKPGIQHVQARLKVAEDGKPRIFFMRDALVRRDPDLVDRKLPCCTIEELPGYVWEDKVAKEEPVKENDHGLDPTRYIVAERDMRSRPGIRVMGGGRRR